MNKNRRRTISRGLGIGLLLLITVTAIARYFFPAQFAFEAGSGDISSIVMPDGFEITVFADEIDGARTLRLGNNGTLFIGSRGPGKIYAIPNAATSEQAENILEFDSDLDMPNGLALVDGDLYVAENSEIWRYPDVENNLNSPQRELVSDQLPTENHHGWRYLGYGPDEKLYVAIGAPCNACEVEGFHGTISRLNLDGSELEPYSFGVRNSVGFDWHPETGDLWFTDNGRDLMGDDLPPDTLHFATESGQHFGYPYCHGDNIPDPDLGDKRSCDEFIPPAMNMTPHGASLGMRFYTGDMFPDEYAQQIFVAEHGSWNRTVPIGYRIMLARLDGAREVVSYEPFAEGWLNDATGEAWGRPVDVLVMPDGAMLVSDDANDAIYRISYTGTTQ